MSVGVLQDNLVLSTKLKADVSSASPSFIRSDEGRAFETSAFAGSLYGGQFTLSTQLIKPNSLESASLSYVLVLTVIHVNAPPNQDLSMHFPHAHSVLGLLKCEMCIHVRTVTTNGKYLCKCGAIEGLLRVYKTY